MRPYLPSLKDWTNFCSFATGFPAAERALSRPS